MTWFPGWRWFVEPSGPAMPPRPHLGQLLDGVKRCPIVAHPVGGALVFLGFRWLALVFGAPPLAATMVGIAADAFGEAINQFYKAKRGVYGAELWLNVIWREVLALAGAGLTAWIVQ